jgi:VanZ family protein
MDEREAPQPAENDYQPADGIVKYARPALIAAVAIAIISLALLVIIFFLDSFNATVYSVGGKDIADATQEAGEIRDLYTPARIGSVVFLIASAATAAVAGVILFRNRTSAADDEDNGENVGFEGLAGNGS